MSPRFSLSSLLTPILPGLAAVLLHAGCRVNEQEIEEQDRYFKEDPVRVPEVHVNRLANEPTAFLRSRAADPVHWQPWSPALLEHSRLEQKPIFAFVTGGNFPRTQDILEKLTADPKKIRALHSNYLCTLVDINAHPEMGLLAYHLSMDINRPVAFPFMAWFSQEGNAFAWLPLRRTDTENFDAIFDSSHEMVRETWNDDPRYVIMNSRRDNAKRGTALTERISATLDEKADLRASLQKSARGLSALYDPTSGQIDQNGGLVPFSILQFAGAFANDAATSPTLKKRLLALLAGHSALIRTAAIHDPLDGGYFYARRNRHGWSLPLFLKDGGTQLEGIIAFSRLAGLVDRESQLSAAQEVLSFTESRLGGDTPGIGIYELPARESLASEANLWASDKLQELLPAEEFAVAEKCFGIKGIGNIPSEADSRRDYFRLNSLRLAMPPEEAAAELGLPPERARELLASARQRLLVHRRERIDRGELVVESTQVTSINARLVTALVNYRAVSGDEKSLARARELMADLRARHYSEENGLMRIPAADGRRGIPARGYDYALLIDALFAVYRQDLDPAHLAWAEALADEAIAKLADADGLLHEAPKSERIQTVPIRSYAMIFGGSTWGSIFGSLARLELLTGSEEIGKIRAEIEKRLPRAFEEIPIQHTDFGTNALVALSGTVVYLEGPVESGQLGSLLEVLREPVHDSVTMVHLAPGLPASFKLPEPAQSVRALVIRDGKQAGEAATPAELRALLAPSAPAE